MTGVTMREAGRRPATAGRQHARLAAGLHQSRPRLPGQGSRDSRCRPHRQGPANRQHFAMQPDETVATMLPIRDSPGTVPLLHYAPGPGQANGAQRISVGAFNRQNRNRARSSDELAWVASTGGKTKSSCSSQNAGKAIRFSETMLRSMGRQPLVCIGIRLRPGRPGHRVRSRPARS